MHRLALSFLACCITLLGQSLTGLWIDDNGNLYSIEQTGNNVKLTTHVSQVFVGTLTGRRLDLKCKLTEPFIPRDRRYPQWVIDELLKQDIVVDGSMSADGISIDATRHDIYGQYKETDQTHTVTLKKQSVPVSLARFALKAEWKQPDERVAASKYTLTLLNGTSMPVVPLKYSPSDPLELDVSIDTSRIPHLIPGMFIIDGAVQGALSNQTITVNVSEKMFDGKPVQLFNSRAQFDVHGLATIKFPGYPTQKDLLNAFGTAFNLNALHADVRMTTGAQLIQASTEKKVHIIRQKGVLFFPGVFGSKIWITSGASELEAYDNLTGHILDNVFSVRRGGAKLPFELLDTNTAGVPAHKATGLEVLETLGGVIPVYRLGKDQPAVNSPAGHAKLRKDGSDRDEPYYIAEQWPYDWRLRIEQHLDSLRGGTSCEDIRPKYNCPPSVQGLIKKLKEEFWFLDAKLAAVGHSTGGLIMRAMLADSNVGSNFDKAYFVTVPFWGAPKAYYVYLTGDQIPFIRNELLRRLAPNMPIVYYLAPTEKYPDDVVKNGFGQTPAKRKDVTQGILEPLIREAKSAGAYPRNLDDPSLSCVASKVGFTPGDAQDPDELADEKRAFKILGLANYIPGKVLPPGDKALMEDAIKEVQDYYKKIQPKARDWGYGFWVQVSWDECEDSDCSSRVQKQKYQLVPPPQNRAQFSNPRAWNQPFIDRILKDPGSIDYLSTVVYARDKAEELACPAEFRNPNTLWNRTLEAQAKTFHAVYAGTPVIGWSNTYAFYSLYGKTAGAVSINGKSVVFDEVPGDGTVPCISQQAQGDFQGTLLHIDGDPEHRKAANGLWVWQQIIDSLVHGQVETTGSSACAGSPLNTDKPPPTDSLPLPLTDCPTASGEAPPEQIQKTKIDDTESQEVSRRLGWSAAELGNGRPSKRPVPGNSLWNTYVDYYDARVARIEGQRASGQTLDQPPLTWDAYRDFVGKFRRGTDFQSQVTDLLRKDNPNSIVISNAGLLKDKQPGDTSDPTVKYVDQLVVSSNSADGTVDSYSNKSRNQNDYATGDAFMAQVKADADELRRKYGGDVNVRRQFLCNGQGFLLYNTKVRVRNLNLIYDENALLGPRPPPEQLQQLENNIRSVLSVHAPDIILKFSDGRSIHD